MFVMFTYWHPYMNIGIVIFIMFTYRYPYINIIFIMFTCRYPYINIIFFCCDWLAMSNSSYNPFIYVLCNVNIKLLRLILLVDIIDISCYIQDKFKKELRARMRCLSGGMNYRTNFADRLLNYTTIEHRTSGTCTHDKLKNTRVSILTFKC